MTIGFIGLGAMGRPMATCLVKGSFDVLLYNRTRARAEDLIGRGAKWASSPAEVAARSDVVIVMVSDDAAAHEVLLGPQGVVHQIGQGTVVANMSTVSMAATRQLAAAMESRQASYLDAPVAGSTGSAKGGDLIIFAGGTKAALDIAMPAFKALARDVIHLGPSGSGIVMKLITNAVLGLSVAAFAEALSLGERCGLPADLMIQAFTSTAVASPVMKTKARMWRDGRYSKAFSQKQMLKDLNLASVLASERAVAAPILDLTRSLYTIGAHSENGEDDMASIKRTFDQLGK